MKRIEHINDEDYGLLINCTWRNTDTGEITPLPNCRIVNGQFLPMTKAETEAESILLKTAGRTHLNLYKRILRFLGRECG